MRLVRGTARKQSTTPTLVGVVDSALRADRAGERQWAEMYARMYPRLTDIAERTLGYDAACDAVQEAMVELWERWDTLDIDQRSDAFVARAVRFRVIDQLRRDHRHVTLTEELEWTGVIPPIEAKDAAEVDVVERVDRIIAAMPLRCREVYVLVYEQGLTVRDAAAALGIAFETARTHVKRAHQFLYESLTRNVRNVSSGDALKLLSPRTEPRDE